ncbi:P-loop containing nucleoside triphosphate hydrolase protein [Epithele typhae]|uniref:P-loop containing nucleoside triphosphate hydrolase protein n=1 Tax=Epithele typhae TaxID=378194 RepID=UPI0020071E13|nr:P-loop containing nucleoside triphosphate hydrolase protein [Epithele typhae]KAH9944510.1 P-loop containing nucleoside triphosphate hydrolase protein [Epithele typhae]
MPPKKKKTQLKPVARGFATTSVPKKVVEPPPELETAETKDISTPSNEQVDTASANRQGTTSTDGPQALSGEDEVLQGFVDRFQDKVEKDIVRAVKAIEQERRFTDTQIPARLDLDPGFVERLLELALEYENAELSRSIDEPEDKAIIRLALTFGTLRRLGFSEARVEECLRAMKGVDMDEAFDWLHLHCDEEELGVRQDVGEPPRTPMTPKTPHTARPTHLRSDTGSLSSLFVHSAPASPALSIKSFLDVNAPAFVPGQKPPDAPATPNRTSTPSSLLLDSDPTPASLRWSAVEDPNTEFVRLSVRILELTTHRRPDEKGDAAFLQNLQRRLKAVQDDYFFNARDAHAHFKAEKAKLDTAALQAKLRGLASAAPVKPPRKKPAELAKEPPSPADSSVSVSDVFDDSPNGMFELLEAMPTEVTAESGTTIAVRDMALPKHWSGRTPKVLLTEHVHKTDRYAVISFNLISGASRVKRASVDIRWDGGKTQTWSMDNVACHDETQAEQYIATVALHAVKFANPDGFAIGGTAIGGSQTSFRLLPPVFRDLWDELEQNRRLDDDAINRGLWGKLRNILEPKLSLQSKSGNRVIKAAVEAKEQKRSQHYDNGRDVDPEQIVADFQARQASPAYQEMLRSRNQLPMAQYKQDLLSLLEMSQIVVLSGETGCGKSTQVPAFILEDQLLKGRHCRIYCTEPRRISAISLAQRVSRELGEPAGAVGTGSSLVGYAIRLESNINRRTRLAYVTNGIALRMLEGGSGQGGQGTAFDEITHIIIDEVHERTIESDFLLIVLKSLLVQRPDLKIVLMSATLEAEKISAYFGGCPVLSVPGRTFPVDVRFLEDAVETTRWKVTEGSQYAIRGKDKFSRTKARQDWSEETAAAEDDDEDQGQQEKITLEKRYSPETISTVNLLDERLIPYDLIVRLLERICFEDPSYESYSAATLIFMPGMGEIRRLNDMLVEHRSFGDESQFRIYPLHSTISSDQQGAVFDIPPPGVRKIVIATNIAETGITIPDITCVIDTGKHREMRFDEKRQISRLVETFIARSNAAQRRGRAGRVQRGLCFHLFTKVRHDTKLAGHPDPEIIRLSLSDLALRIKIMKVNLGSSIEDVLSRALDPPLAINVQRAVSALVEVNALTSTEDITPMGRLLSQLPTDVHLGKFLLIATLFRCLDPALTIAATLNSKSPFLTPLGCEAEAERAKLSFRVENSDFLTIHNAFASWRRASANGIARKFCKQNYLSHQNLQQIEELRQQFLGYLVDSHFIHVDRAFVKDLSRARYGRNKARFVAVPPALDVNADNAAMVHAALVAGLYPKVLAIDTNQKEMKTITNNQAASFHPSSVNFKRRLNEFGVNHLSYFTLMHSKKLYAWETGPVEDMALLLLCGDAEFKLMASSVWIDRKVRFRVPPKTSIALKLLKQNLASILATQYRVRPLTEPQLRWNELAMMILGRVKLEGPPQLQDGVTLVVHNRT